MWKSFRAYKNSITVKIILIVMILVIPLNLWVIFSNGKVQESIYQNARNNITSIGQISMQNLDDRISASDGYLFSTLASDTFFLNVAAGYNFKHNAINLYQELSDHFLSSDDADAIFFYSADHDYIDVATKEGADSNQQYLKTILTSMIAGSNLQPGSDWQLISMDGTRYLIRCAKLRDMYYGALIDLTQITKDLVDSLPYQSTTAVFSSEAPASSGNTSVTSINSGSQLVFSCSSSKQELYLVLTTNRSEILENLPLLQRVGWGISLAFLLVMPLLLFFLYRIIIRPTQILLDAMRKVSEGSSDYQITARASSEEFALLYKDFNRMVLAQKEMSEDLVAKETYSKQLELQNLMIQIRPHFLMNSFNLLYGLVGMKKTEPAQRLIMYLSDYFRYLFQDNRTMALFEKELDLIQKYMEVARLRYPFISFEETHTKEVLQVEVPQLLIHNFIENVLKHGLRVSEMTNITLDAYCEEETAVFLIEDDGLGMSQENVNAINSGSFVMEDHKKHLGMQNAWQRMKFLYGEKATLYVASEKGKGTQVEIRIPLNFRTGK